LNALRVFVAVGRLGSFTTAAAFLGVTQSAVSRQISLLEGFIGQRLFVRAATGTALTDAGRRFWDETAPALDHISRATTTARISSRREPLRLRVYATFAVKWLLHRLPRFNALHPSIDLQLSTTAAPVDFDRDAVDLAIQFGSGHWPGLESQFLLPDIIQPVCNPRLAAEPGAHDIAAMLGRHRMLHSHYRRRDWSDWLDAVGHPNLVQPGSEFPSSVLTQQAAIDGLGIAIGQMALLAEDLDAGRLVTLFDRPVRRPLGHFLVWPASRPPGQKGRAFVDWVRQEVPHRDQPPCPCPDPQPLL
jgi:LysR family glycine cleavage system transcriptional activator